MLTYLYLILGVTIFLLTFSDFLITVFSPKGAGIITEKVNTYGSKFYSFVVGRKGTNTLLDYKVIFLIVSIIVIWITLIWLSCFLVFMSNPNSIIDSDTKLNASSLDKFYFTGYTLSTLGPGDYKPNGDIWKLFTNLCSFFGFFLISICITYIVPLVSNITKAKALSLKISGLGESLSELLINSFNGESFEELTNQFSSLSDEILTYATNHLAYPILHQVHNSNREENIILKLASLDEALNIFIYLIPDEYNNNPLGLQQVRRAISTYLKTLKNLKPSEKAPPIPDLSALQKSVPIDFLHTDPKQLQAIYSQIELRMKLHNSNLEKDGWKWEDIVTDYYMEFK
ncbi:ion channel [Marivirga sp.]|uniref:ion channel n=1 Tax=Marivirga sp. TaxID=2018662 RepID=UPI002D7E7BC3|nr:ion channel [Marivirga sp.]HET8859521.1 ion channel [Marivirga sp.]